MSLVDQIIGVESGGKANAKNPRSSASGLGQFIDSTWLAMLAKHRPDLVQGKSKEEILSLKSDPQLSRAMTEAYAADNSQILQSAGLPVTPGTQYLAHFAGPQGAASVLKADPNAPVGSILGAGAVKANPFLQGMTAADLQAWANRKMGGQPSSTPPTPQQPVQTQVAALPAAPQGLLPSGPSFNPGGAAHSLLAMMSPQPPLMEPIIPPKPKVDLSKLRASFQPRQFGGVFLKG